MLMRISHRNQPERTLVKAAEGHAYSRNVMLIHGIAILNEVPSCEKTMNSGEYKA